MSNDIAKMLGKAKKRKGSAVAEYSIIGHGGAKDGVLLQPNERFARSWTVLNTLPPTSKEKGRVMKIVHHSGDLLKEQLYFLWPVPGKSVEVTLDLVAPSKPGWYESYWKLEGNDEADFWVKFEVLGVKNENHSKSDVSETSTVETSNESESVNENEEETLLRPHSSLRKKTSQTIKRMSLRRKKRSISQSGHSSITPEVSKLLGNSGVIFDLENPVHDIDMLTSSGSISERMSNLNSLAFLGSKTRSHSETVSTEYDLTSPAATTAALEASRKKRKPKVKKNQAKTKTLSQSTEDGIVVREKYRDLTQKKSPTPQRRTSIVEKWEEQAIDETLKKKTLAERVRKANSMEREVSLKNIHNTQKNKIIQHISSSGSSDNIAAIARNPRPRVSASRTVSAHTRAPGTQPNLALLKEALKKVENLIYISHQLREDAEEIRSNFHMDRTLVGLTEECDQQIENLVTSFRGIKETLSTKTQDAPNVYFIANLPANLWLHIFSFLSVQDLGRVAQVSSFWQHLSRDDSLWKEKLQALHLPATPKDCRFIVENFRFKSLYRTEIEFSDWFDSERNYKASDSKITLKDESSQWPIYDIDITENENSLVSVSDCVRVYDVKKRKLKAVMTDHEKATHCVKIAKGSQACITGSMDKTVKIWSLSSFECMNTFVGHTGAVKDLQQLDNIIISTSMQDKTIRFWNPVSGENIHTVESKDGVTCLALNSSRPSTHLYFGTVNGKVVQWDVEAQVSVFSQKITTGMIEGLFVFEDIIAASDFTRITLTSMVDPSLECLSPMMNRSVGRLQYDGYRLGAQVGNLLDIFDIRYLFHRCGSIGVDNQWKGAFQFIDDSVVIGSGVGQVYNWKPEYSLNV